MNEINNTWLIVAITNQINRLETHQCQHMSRLILRSVVQTQTTLAYRKVSLIMKTLTLLCQWRRIIWFLIQCTRTKCMDTLGRLMNLEGLCLSRESALEFRSIRLFNIICLWQWNVQCTMKWNVPSVNRAVAAGPLYKGQNPLHKSPHRKSVTS